MEGAGGNGQFAAMFTHKGRDLEQNVFLHIHVIVVIGAHGKSIKKQLKGKVAAGFKIKGKKIMLDARMLGEHPVDVCDDRLDFVDVALAQAHLLHDAAICSARRSEGRTVGNEWVST